MKKLYEEEKIRAIALKIREYLVGDDEDGVKYTTDEMPDKVDDACGVAREWGWEDCYESMQGQLQAKYDEGYAQGKADSGGDTNEIYNDGYNDGWDDGYSDGQSLFLTDFADWTISWSDDEATFKVVNNHPSLTLQVTFVADNYTRTLNVAPNSYASHAIINDTAAETWFIKDMKFVK